MLGRFGTKAVAAASVAVATSSQTPVQARAPTQASQVTDLPQTSKTLVAVAARETAFQSDEDWKRMHIIIMIVIVNPQVAARDIIYPTPKSFGSPDDEWLLTEHTNNGDVILFKPFQASFTVACVMD